MSATLYVIPARGGSKGIPGKNIKLLGGKPLINYTLEIALAVAEPADICVSTDSADIISVVERFGTHVPFIRPAELATDEAGTNEVLVHAWNWYAERGKRYDRVMLLQPTSPFRTAGQLREVSALFDTGECDMVASVKCVRKNIAAISYSADERGDLYPLFTGQAGSRRQDAADIYELNGSIYLFSAQALLENGIRGISKIRKYEMPEIYSCDIDTPLDWAWCEFVLAQGLLHNQIES